MNKTLDVLLKDLLPYLIIAWAISTLACAKIPHKVVGRDCEHQASAQDITYPDGVTRKSEVTSCLYENGLSCSYVSFVNDGSVNFTNCP